MRNLKFAIKTDLKINILEVLFQVKIQINNTTISQLQTGASLHKSSSALNKRYQK
jgi:hypothetical protein